MTHLQRIETHLTSHPGLCDDCLAKQLNIHPRQTVNGLCRKAANRIARQQKCCIGCSEMKTVNLPTTETTCTTLTCIPKARKTKSRSQDLRTQLNQALISVFPLKARDYYQELSFTQLLQLKQGLARIHDTVTLKLTFELVNWIADRFQLSPDDAVTLRKQADDQSANASGFDLRWEKPRLIAEVKGCIPVNGGEVFGAAQVRSLTNDVLQMLGLPPKGKVKEQLSSRSKVHHPANAESIKLLALYDSKEVREATGRWRKSVEGEQWFSALMPPVVLQEAPDDGPLNDPNTIYLVFLTPIHAFFEHTHVI